MLAPSFQASRARFQVARKQGFGLQARSTVSALQAKTRLLKQPVAWFLTVMRVFQPRQGRRIVAHGEAANITVGLHSGGPLSQWHLGRLPAAPEKHERGMPHFWLLLLLFLG